MKTLHSAAVALLCCFLTGCATTTDFKTGDSVASVDLNGYKRVVVEDFGESVSAKAKDGSEARSRRGAEAKEAGRQFANKIAAELLLAGAFADARREGKPDSETLIVGGVITRLTQGDVAARLLIGLGAGNSRFEAIVELRDPTRTTTLARLKVDRNSSNWGGWMAASQTVDFFMDEAAKKVAVEIVAAKARGKSSKPAVGK